MCPRMKKLLPLIEFEVGVSVGVIILLGYGIFTGKFNEETADSVRDMLIVFSFSATVLNAIIACILVFCRKACSNGRCKNKNT